MKGENLTLSRARKKVMEALTRYWGEVINDRILSARYSKTLYGTCRVDGLSDFYFAFQKRFSPAVTGCLVAGAFGIQSVFLISTGGVRLIFGSPV